MAIENLKSEKLLILKSFILSECKKCFHSNADWCKTVNGLDEFWTGHDVPRVNEASNGL